MVDKTTNTAYEEAQKGLISALLYKPREETKGKDDKSRDGGDDKAKKHIVDDNVNLVRGLVHEEDFSDGTARSVYNAILRVKDHNKELTYANIVTQLHDDGTLVEAGGIETVEQYFNDSSRDVGDGAIIAYTKIIKNISSKYRIRKISDELKAAVEDPHEFASDIIEASKDAFTKELMSLSSTQNSIDIENYADTYLARLDEKVDAFRNSNENELAAEKGIPSSFKTINDNTGGWLPGQLNVVGARTGIGKSFFLVQEALQAACEGDASVLFFSLEMLYGELMDRFISSYTYIKEKPVSLGKLKHGSISDPEKAFIHECVNEIKSKRITIDTTPNITLEHIRAKAQQMLSGERGLDIILIDYLQLVQPPKGEMNRERQVAEISRGLKLLSMQLGIPIIVAVQLNRLHKGDEDPTPTINDIRESNAIAQDASVIVLIHRNTAENEDGSYDPATFIIGKNRNGSSGIRFKCKTSLGFSRFDEIRDTWDDGNDDDDSVPSGNGNVQRLGGMSDDEMLQSLNNNHADDDDGAYHDGTDDGSYDYGDDMIGEVYDEEEW